jgi:hypothetical protein
LWLWLWTYCWQRHWVSGRPADDEVSAVHAAEAARDPDPFEVGHGVVVVVNLLASLSSSHVRVALLC